MAYAADKRMQDLCYGEDTEARYYKDLEKETEAMTRELIRSAMVESWQRQKSKLDRKYGAGAPRQG